jgi:hypothetical protein
MRVQRKLGVLAVALGLVAAIAAPVLADLTPASAKTAIRVGTIGWLTGPTTSGSYDSDWVTLTEATIKTASGKDLLITSSLECGLYTGTTVSSKNGQSDTSVSNARIQVRVLVDGQPAQPGTVTYAARTQTLSATLEGMIAGALTIDPVTGAVVLNESLVTPEQVSLVLDTMQASSFTYAASVGVGMHTVTLQARIDQTVAYQNGSAVAQASIGKGTLAVETVRLVDKGAEMDF